MSYKKTIVVGLFLFGLVVLIALSTFYASLGSCPIDSLSCDNGTFCVPRKLVCNFVKDCQDGQDENVWRCGNLYGSKKVIYADALEGKKVYEEFNKTYQFQNINDFWDYCGFNENEIPKGCKCMKVNLIRCRNRSEIPANFPREVGMIHLRGNSITLRSTDTFELYKNLSYLDLAFNHISSIPPKLLYKLKLLRKLFLQHNQIEELPVEIFSNLQSLSWLLLNFNHLRDFDLNVVRDLESLQYLELSYNNLKLRNASFPNLNQLYELFLDFNFIEELGVGLLGNLHNLTLLSVRSNHINVISSPTFSNLGRLQELRLSDNPIHILDSDFFLKLANLNAL
ncbi:CLUMA_CG004499, isoform A [Clunio marinus]|uniref:CLUMA_CG004499, isoform A n=1 Tax=Clunio marinus TaxID=568069 RepID=A0A1J1HXE6_9DIPT|nr:CLUMA_CG004499, isoform A [Clunio marinus]